MQPPKSPGLLSRGFINSIIIFFLNSGNTTESTGGSGIENSNSEKNSTKSFLLGTKFQRPQLLKASTFNASAVSDLESLAKQQNESTSFNCNGILTLHDNLVKYKF